LRKQSSHQKSLDDVMRVLWQRFGKPFVGYTLQDYKDIVEEIAGEELPWYWTTCVHTNTPLQELLNEMLSFVGLQMSVETEGNVLLNTLDDLHGSIQRTLWLSSNTIFEEEPGE
jgi:predicted metalloprotease with PDZ domain